MTKKIAEQRVGKAMEGALLLFATAIGGEGKNYSVGKFVSKIARYGRGTGRLANAMYYFVPSGTYGGGGTLTPAMAADAADFIRESLLAGGNNHRYKGPKMAALSTEYAHWKENVSNFRGSPLMRLTGNMAGSIVLRKSAGKTIVTVDTDRVSPSPAPGVQGVKLSDYVFAHEMGTSRMPNRPIITGSMLGWIQLRSHSWKVAFQRLMKETVWMAEDRGSQEDLADDLIQEGTSGSSAIDILANINRQADKIDNLAKKVSETAANLLFNTARRGAAKPYSSAEIAQLRPILMREMVGSGYSPEKIGEIVDIAFGGRIPREYLYT